MYSLLTSVSASVRLDAAEMFNSTGAAWVVVTGGGVVVTGLVVGGAAVVVVIGARVVAGSVVSGVVVTALLHPVKARTTSRSRDKVMVTIWFFFRYCMYYPFFILD